MFETVWQSLSSLLSLKQHCGQEKISLWEMTYIEKNIIFKLRVPKEICSRWLMISIEKQLITDYYFQIVKRKRKIRDRTKNSKKLTSESKYGREIKSATKTYFETFCDTNWWHTISDTYCDEICWRNRYLRRSSQSHYSNFDQLEFIIVVSYLE